MHIKNKYLLVGFVVIFSVIFFRAYYWLDMQKNTKESISDDMVVMDTNNLYPDFLPYISSNVDLMYIDVPNGRLDPTHYVSLKATGFQNEYVPSTSRLYMVQYKTTPSTELYMDTRPLRTFLNNVFIITADYALLEQFTKNPNVNFIDHYHPHYKLDQKVVEAYYQVAVDKNTKFQLVFSPFALPIEIAGILQKKDIKPDFISRDGQYYTIDGLEDRQQIFAYAMNPLISEIRLIDE